MMKKQINKTWIFALMGGMLISIGAAERVPKKLWEVAEPVPVLENNPRYSDVSFSSRWARPRHSGDPHDTLKAMEAFHATRLDWIYSYDADFFGRIKKKFNVPISTSLTASIADRIDGTVRSKGRMRDIDGNLVTAPWMPLQWGAFYGCANNPAFKMIVLNYIKAGLDAGADGFQSDGVLPNEYMIQNGACFCQFCMDGFKTYLNEHFSAAELKSLGIQNIEQFDFRARVRANDKTIPAQLLTPFKEFQFEADKNLMDLMRRSADAYAEKRIFFATNNGSYQTWERNQVLYDFGIAELMKEMATPWHLYGSSLKARYHGKFQIINMPKYTPDVTPRERIVALTRRVIGTGYAVGMPVMVPWDAWIRGDIRFFGEPEEFAHFYKMVRQIPHLLDGYEDAFVTGEHIRDRRYTDALPLEILGGSGQVYAFVRAMPRKPDAPVVVHVIDWSPEPQPFVLKFNRDRFFDAPGMKIQLISPYQEMNVLAEGNLTYVSVPAQNPWAVLVVEPSNVQLPPQPEMIPFGQAFTERLEVTLVTPLTSGRIHYTLDGSVPNLRSPVYTRPVVLGDSTTITARTLCTETNHFSAPVDADFTHYPLISAQTPPVKLTQGLSYELFSFEGTPEWQGFFREFPDFDELTPIDSGTTAAIDLTPSTRRDRFGLRFRGYLNVAQTGLYRFHVRADDECKLSIAGRKVVFNSGRKFSIDEMRGLAVARGEHFEESAAPQVWATGVTHSGLIALEKGFHSLDVHYTQMLFEKHLDIYWEGPNIEKAAIPERNFFTVITGQQ